MWDSPVQQLLGIDTESNHLAPSLHRTFLPVPRCGHGAMLSAYQLAAVAVSPMFPVGLSHFSRAHTKVLTQLFSAGLSWHVTSKLLLCEGAFLSHALEILSPRQLQTWPVLEYVTCLGKHSCLSPNPELSDPLS